MTIAVGNLRNVRINPDIENEGTLTSESHFNSFIFNRQHVVQKSLKTFLG